MGRGIYGFIVKVLIQGRLFLQAYEEAEDG